MSTKKSNHWNIGVARKRGAEWRRKLSEGKLAAKVNPTLVRIKRKKAGYTQLWMAKMVGMSCTSYSQVEAGNRRVTKDRAAKIATVLGSKIPFLFVPAKIKGRFLASFATKEQGE